MKNYAFVLAVLTACVSVNDACAHRLGQSYMFLTINNTSIKGRFEITVGDLNAVFPQQFATDGTVSESDLAGRIGAIKAYVAEHARFAPNGVATEIRMMGHELLNLKLAQFVVIEFELGELSQRPRYIDIHYAMLFDVLAAHRGLLVVEDDWKSGTLDNAVNVSLVFGPGTMDQALDLTSSSVLRGFVAMMQLGTHHIWIGIDHILFLIALLLPGVVRRKEDAWEAVETFKPALIYLVKIVSVFTVAHTITLSLATLQAIVISPRIVESVIALSIAIAAFDIIVPVFKHRIWLIVFGFGLFHGFGFASVLGEIGIPPAYMLHSLLGFNLGVEIGQLAIVAVVFPLLYAIRSFEFFPRFVLRYGATALIVVSLYWFVERGFEVDLPAGQLVNSLLDLIA